MFPFIFVSAWYSESFEDDIGDNFDIVFPQASQLTIRGIDQILMVYVRVSSGTLDFVYRKLRQTPQNPPKNDEKGQMDNINQAR